MAVYFLYEHGLHLLKDIFKDKLSVFSILLCALTFLYFNQYEYMSSRRSTDVHLIGLGYSILIFRKVACENFLNSTSERIGEVIGVFIAIAMVIFGTVTLSARML